MSNGLPDPDSPDSLLTPGGRPVNVVNGVLNGLNPTANGFNGPDFIFFPLMAIGNNRLRYQISVYLLCTHIRSFLNQRSMKLDLRASLQFHPSLTGNSFTPPSFPYSFP